MNVLRFVWSTVAATLAFVGFGVAIHWPTGTLLAAWMAGASLVNLITAQYTVCTLDDGPGVPPRVASELAANAFLGGTATVAVAGLAELLGLWALPAVLLLSATSPYAVRAYGRWLLRDGMRPHLEGVGSPGDTPPVQARHDAEAQEIDWQRLFYGRD
jgi:hypothetical protein